VGVGLFGFVELREKQFEVVDELRFFFALIVGG
jgi:hypothetical protein